MSANTDWVVDIVIPKRIRVKVQAVTSAEAEEEAREHYPVLEVEQVLHWSQVDPDYQEED